MIEYELTSIPPNYIIHLLTLSSVAMATFTKAQRREILRRDNTSCQMNCELTHFCGGPTDRVDVHHIRSQSWCRAHGIDPNTFDNAITLCRTHHNSLHPAELSILKSSQPNWKTDEDDFLIARALTNNRNHLNEPDTGSLGRTKKDRRRRIFRLFRDKMRIQVPPELAELHASQYSDTLFNRRMGTK